MTPQELAALLNGREYGSEITKSEEAEARAAGLVVVFGYSDYYVEFRGAIDDEIEAYGGTKLRVTPLGLLEEWEGDRGFTEKEAERFFEKKRAGFQTIEAVWCPKLTEADAELFASWAYKTDIPHATFDVIEDFELFCRGIVFRLADVQGASTS